MRACFAFNEATSPISGVRTVGTKTYPPVQCMGLVMFHTLHWDFDSSKNYKPSLVCIGSVERIDAIDSKFPHNMDTIYFNERDGGTPVEFRCDLTEDQLAKLAKKGFYSEKGAHLGEVLTTAKFQLELDVSVKEYLPPNQKQGIDAPILSVDVLHPYENVLVENQYDITDYISREQEDEKKVIENTKTYEDYVPEDSIASEVEKIKAAEAERIKTEQAAAYKPLTPEEMDIRNRSANVSSYVEAITEQMQQRRDAGNAAAEEERARIAAEQAALAAKTAESKPDEDPDIVKFDDERISKVDTDNSKLVETDESNKFENNEAVFNNGAEADDEIPEGIAKLMARFGDTSQVDSKTGESDKKDDNASGSASGTQTDNNYTFENDANAPRNEADKNKESRFGNKPGDDKKNEESGSGSGSNSDSGSGAASGNQTSTVYTFENDPDAPRNDADKNKEDRLDKDEKSDDKSDDKGTDDKKSVPEPKSVDYTYKKAQIDAVIHDTTVETAVDPAVDDRSK